MSIIGIVLLLAMVAVVALAVVKRLAYEIAGVLVIILAVLLLGVQGIKF